MFEEANRVFLWFTKEGGFVKRHLSVFENP